MTDSTMISVTMYNPVYKIIYRYEYLLPVVATAGVGLVNFGPIGLSAGALGAIDMIANHYHIYEKPYFTSSVLGWGSLSSLKTPYYIADMLGATVGLLFQTGIFNAHLDKVGAPVYGLISGYSYGGVYGAVAGVTAGVIDEALSMHNMTHSYPLTYTLNNIAMSNLLLPQSAMVMNYILPESFGMIKTGIVGLTKFVSNLWIKEAIAVTASAILIDYNAIKTKSQVLQLTNDLYEVYSKIIPAKQLDDLIEKQTISLVSVQFIIQKLSQRLTGHRQNLVHSFEDFDSNLSITWPRFLNYFKHFALFLPLLIVGRVINSFINEYFRTKLTYMISDQISKEWMTGEVALKLANDNYKVNSIDSNILIKNMNEDITVVVGKGSMVLTDACSTVITSSYGIGCLLSIGAESILIYSSIYNKLAYIVSHHISTKFSSYTNGIKAFEAQISSMIEHIMINADSMTQRDATTFANSKLIYIIEQLRILKESRSLWETANDIWLYAQDIIDFLFNYLVIAYKLHNGELPFDQRLKVLAITHDIFKMAAWSGHHAGEIVTVAQSITRLTELKNQMKEIEQESKHAVHYLYQQSDHIEICFNKLTIGIEDSTLAYIDNLCIKDKILAITGPSGCGKTTLLKIVKNIKYDTAWGEGNITYYTTSSKAPKIIMVSQRDYLLPYTTLLELITFQANSSMIQFKDQVKDLLREIQIDYRVHNEEEISLISLLHEERVWDKYLSGGQKKKIAVIWLILQQPDIAILDEILNGLDKQSIVTIEAMFKKHLPNTQFLIVDHHAADNNYNGFYDHELRFENKKIGLFSVASKEDSYSTDDKIIDEQKDNLDCIGDTCCPATISDIMA